MQVVSHAIQPSVLAVHLGFSDSSACQSFLWISPDVVDSVVRNQACEYVTKSLFHPLKGLLLCGNAQIIEWRYFELSNICDKRPRMSVTMSSYSAYQ